MIDYINNYLLEIDCTNIVSSINNAISEYIDILTSIIPYILTQLYYDNVGDLGYKTQVSRLLDLVNYFIITIPNLKVNNECSTNVVSNILMWLFDNALILGNSLVFMQGISSLIDECKCIDNGLLSIYIGRLTNSITKLQFTIQPLYDMINIVICTSFQVKNYVAAYVPNYNIPVQTFNTEFNIYNPSNNRWGC